MGESLSGKGCIADPRMPNPMQTDCTKTTTGVGADDPIYTIRVTRKFVRKMAQLSSDAGDKLRVMVPQAFINPVVKLGFAIHTPMGWVAPNELPGVRVRVNDSRILPAMYEETCGDYKGLGLHLDSRYTWEIVPVSFGGGCTLIAREPIV